MKLKLLLLGIGLLLVGIVLANVTCPSGNCPGNSANALSGLVVLAGIIVIPIGVLRYGFGRRLRPGVPVASDPSLFLNGLLNRLNSAGFTIARDIKLPPYQLDLLARKVAFEPGKFGNMTRYVVVSRVGSVDLRFVREFSSRVTKFAFENPGTGLPRGMGSAVLVVPVLISEDFDDTVKDWVTERRPPRHWAASEFPVLVSTRQMRTYYFRKTPIWGAAYYRGYRGFVEAQIGSRIPPSAQA